MPLSPMMQQYLETKEKYKDCILLYRLGDFYEMFFDDAIEISRTLELTLTGRDCGLAERAPMCGIPHHALDTYMPKLIERGYKVAICEQLTPPGKGIVERDVVRVVTPGTVMESSMLEEDKHNYIASVFYGAEKIGISWADITTGDFFCSEAQTDPDHKTLQDVLTRVMPSEIIANEAMFTMSDSLPCVKMRFIPKFTLYKSAAFESKNAENTLKTQFGTDIKKFGLETKDAASRSAGALIDYLNETQKRSLLHINKIQYSVSRDYMVLDMNTRRNLELTSSIQERKKYGSLLWLLDATKTGMGTRNLSEWIQQPLQNPSEINKRLDAVEEIKSDLIMIDNLKENFAKIRDIERLTGKIAYNSITPRDVEALGKSLAVLPEIVRILSGVRSELLYLAKDGLKGLEAISDLIEKAIIENAPTGIKDGGFLKPGYNKQLDEYLGIRSNSEKWLLKIEEEERKKTGIKNLKIGYNKVFGYFIEVTNSYLNLVPYDYQRKQTLTGAERFITPELKEMEEKILNAQENSIKLEIALFGEIRNTLLKQLPLLQNAAKAIAVIDTVMSLAITANKYNYCRPKISSKVNELHIKDGRHPVVEALLKGDQFVPNDTDLNGGDSKAMLITGPNMAGKSTYMRQVALITLMAHIGSFVPAKAAEIPITDKIFTRVGASDNLAFSQSTFMVEMSEVAHILKNVTPDSLILLDEVGRGTSTYDGMSIAWAVIKYLAENTTAKVLFATHYHELIDLEYKLSGIKNYKVLVKELADGVIFLRKIVRGGADKSFGIEVAKLAGLPREVIEDAKSIMNSLDAGENVPSFGQKPQDQLPAKYAEIINVLKDTDINSVTPLIAFDTLNELVRKATQGEKNG